MKALAKVKVAALIVVLLGILAGASAAEVPTTIPSDMGAYAALTKRDIQTAIEAKVKSIRNFAVTFHVVVVDAGPDEIALQHRACVVEGVKMYCVNETTNNADRPQETSRGEVAYDGQVSMTRPGAFRALVFRGREWWATENQYYDLMMQHAGWEDDPGGGHSNSLVSIARAETTKLRPDVEMVEGHPCRVLDAYEGGRLHQSVWLDCQRGFLPVRQRIFMGVNQQQQLVMEFEIDRAIQIQDMWFATSGRKVSYPWKAKYPNEYARTKVSVAKIFVDQYQPGNVPIRVNQQLPEDQFDLRKRLPLGTMVLETEATTRSTSR